FSQSQTTIQFFHLQKKSISKQTKQGLQKSGRGYIAFIDSDDFVEPDYIKTLLDFAVETKADVSCCNLIIEDPSRKELEKYGIEKKQVLNSADQMLNDFFHRYGFYNIVAKLFKRILIEKLDFIDMRNGEDTHMMINAVKVCSCV
ncbi:MAG: glycosyltransferase, partial [Clostridiales bacterium]|nr:glycosyltransferase [Clostridiales bacterium]